MANTNLPPSSENRPIASFNYNDVKDGIGIVTLYGYVSTITGGTDNYYLTSEIVYSTNIQATSVGPHTFTFYGGSFNRPRTLFGTFSLNFCWIKGTDNIYTTVKLYHYDGSTSTQLGSTWTGETKTGGTSAWIENAIIEVSNSKRFKKGDSIKIEIGFSGSANPYYLGTDPANRDGVNIVPSANPTQITQLVARVPFKIDY